MEIAFELICAFLSGLSVGAGLVYFFWTTEDDNEPPVDGDGLYVLTLRQLNIVIRRAQEMVRKSNKTQILTY